MSLAFLLNKPSQASRYRCTQVSLGQIRPNPLSKLIKVVRLDWVGFIIFLPNPIRTNRSRMGQFGIFGSSQSCQTSRKNKEVGQAHKEKSTTKGKQEYKSNDICALTCSDCFRTTVMVKKKRRLFDFLQQEEDYLTKTQKQEEKNLKSCIKLVY